MKTQCTLIADARERNVLRHERELESVNLVVKQITTADYVVLSPGGNVLAAIERKSLEDFAASLKDGRCGNVRKLIELRAATGCRVVYLIEGPEFPSPNDRYGNIPYRHIESSIFHLTVRDNVVILRSRDTLDTAKLLTRFTASMDTLCRDDDIEAIFAGRADDNPAVTPVTLTDTPVIDLLTAKHDKSDHEIVRSMWATFPCISAETADEYMKDWSLADIVRGRVKPAQLSGFRLASGRAISKKVVEGLLLGAKSTKDARSLQVRLLSSVPGISRQSAVSALSVAGLPPLLSWDVGSLSMLPLGPKRTLGKTLAARILQLFDYKYVPASVVESASRPAVIGPAGSRIITSPLHLIDAAREPPPPLIFTPEMLAGVDELIEEWL